MQINFDEQKLISQSSAINEWREKMIRLLVFTIELLKKEVKKQQSLAAYYKGLYEGEKFKNRLHRKHR